MPKPATYKIVVRGRPSSRLLRPLLDDFTVGASSDGETHLVGHICDPAHLHGVLAHLTSVNLEIISIAPTRTNTQTKTIPRRNQHDND